LIALGAWNLSEVVTGACVADYQGPTKQLGSRIPLDLHKRARQAALELDINLEQFVIEGLEPRLAKFESEKRRKKPT
jgi:predicted HicB family RNase H-like nuclease